MRPTPSQTVALVRDSVRHIIKGNCEESLANDSEDCGCGFPEDSDCSRLSDAWFRHARQQLSDADRLWMAGLPERLVLDIDGVRLAVVHGSPSTVNRFVFGSTGHALKLKEIEGAGVDGVIAGHCGLPFTQSVSGYLWHNSGAIGMPANDGTPRVWYSIISRVPDGISIEHRSLVYDHAAAAGKMRSRRTARGLRFRSLQRVVAELRCPARGGNSGARPGSSWRGASSGSVARILKQAPSGRKARRSRRSGRN